MNKYFLLVSLCITGPLSAVPTNSSQRPSSYPFISGDTFRIFSDHIYDETNAQFKPEKVKTGDIVFVSCYDQYIMDNFFKTMHEQIKHPYIIVSHNTDHWIPGKFAQYLDDPKIIAWFSQNIDREHPKLHPLPIGLANYHWPHGKIELVRLAMQSLSTLDQRIDKVYVNFLIDTNRSVRQPVWDYFKTKPFCIMAPKKNYSEYLSEMKQYRFVLCPPGNGIDCHRSWEALLMGCIPIIKHSPIDALFDNLPVILINDWHEVTKEFLEKKYHTIIQNYEQYDLSKIFVDYWMNTIKTLQNQWRNIQ